MIPCPPEVPGKNALIKAEDSVRISVRIIGLPESRTVTMGIFLS